MAQPAIDLNSWSAPHVERIALDLIDPNPQQPRKHFDQSRLDELAASIAQVGLLQPVTVTRAGGRYTLVMGESRVRASRQAGLRHIDAVIRDVAQDAFLLEAVVENTARENLNPMDEALAYVRLKDELGLTQEQIAAHVGKSRGHVSNLMRLVNLPPIAVRMLRHREISLGHAKVLLEVPDPVRLAEFAQRIPVEELSVRALEKIVGEYLQREQDRQRAQRLGHVLGQAPTGHNRPGPATPTRRGEVEDKLAQHFDTAAVVKVGKNRGSITLKFSGEQDLDRLLKILLGP
jgi:ParB family transcriptional regulator, chromosome partitioning protein